MTGNSREAQTGRVYLTDRQVAERYGINRATVWSWVKKAKMPEPVRLTPGCARWSVGDLERWESERREAS